MKVPPFWSEEQLDAEREKAEEHFRQGRHREPLELYLNYFDEYQGVVEEVLEQTVDLTRLRDEAPDILTDERKQEVFRYLSGPPVSLDELKVLVEAKSLTARKFETDPQLEERIVGFMQDWHDRRRFPWVSGKWVPEEHDRNSAVLATTALLAMRKTETHRRTQGSKHQEDLVLERLRRAQYEEVPTRRVSTLMHAPIGGQFCRESMFGSRKADFVVGLLDGRTMAIECKVSNSATNSIKRLNNDAAVKATTWREEFGKAQIVVVAVLEGVFALRNLVDAQESGLTIFWAHDLASMIQWMRIESQ